MKETCDTCIHAEVCKYTKELNGCDFWQNPLEKIRAEIEEQLSIEPKTRLDEQYQYGLTVALHIIGKHTKGE